MTQMKHLWGLPTLEPDTQAVGACLAIGIKPKDRLGFPIEKDRFHIVEPKTRDKKIGGKKVEYRKYDARFAEYNEAPLDIRRTFYGTLCYHLEKECWNPNYGMYRAPTASGLINPRSKLFSCTGNGDQAQRWDGKKLAMIECPGEGCPFRQGHEPPCRPRARFWFLPVWKPIQGKMAARWTEDKQVVQLLERPIMRMATQGREARDTFAGMLKVVRQQAETVGCKILSWYGLPFQIQLSESTGEAFEWQDQNSGRRWPDITFTLDGNWHDWLSWQVQEFRSLSESPPVLALGSASPEELDAELVGAEHAAIVPVTSKPAAVAVADPDPAGELEPQDDGFFVESSASVEVEKAEPANDKRIESWMKETGYDKRKGAVSACLRDASPQLIGDREQWYDIKTAAPWSAIESALQSLPEIEA